MVLNIFEAGGNIPPAPAWGARSGPVVIVMWLPTDVEHGVDGARATKNLAAHKGPAPFTPITLRTDGEAPDQSRIAMGFEIPPRHMDQPAIVLRTCLN